MTPARRFFTPLNLLAAGAVLLLVLDLGLLTRLLLAWHEAGSDQSAAYASDMATYTRLQGEVEQLRSMPARLSSSRTAADTFFAARIPSADSGVVAELGDLAERNHVRLSRAQYTLAPAVTGIVEQRIDASMSGQYSPLMHFINDIERDRNHAFFIIRSVTLTGQQGGTVNLRLRLTTYMHADAASAAILAAATHASAEVQ